MKRTFQILVVLLFVAVSGFAQRPATAASATVGQHQLDSRLMGRPMPYRVILPPDHNRRQHAVPVLYLLHGLFGHFDNWTDKTKLKEYASQYDILIVTPEGSDGWWTDSVTKAYDKYESYIVQELIPEIDKKYRTVANRGGRAIAGLSMGGYGAIKFGLKYPGMFSLVGSFSGALDAPLREQDGSSLWATLIPVYGSLGSQTRIQNDIFALLRSVPTEKLNALPFIYLDCGTEDMFITTNRDFATLLLERKIPHEFRELPGKHEWPYWNQQLQEFLRLTPPKLVVSGIRNN